MPTHLSRQKFIKSFVLLLVLCGLAAVFLPWKSWLENKLTAMFEAKGFQNVHLTVSTLGLNSITLKDVSVGSNTPLTLSHVTVGYSLSDLWRGDINTLTIQGLTFGVQRDHSQWTMTGIEKGSSNSNSNAITLPVTSEQLAAIPLESVQLEDSSLHIIADAWQMDIPLQFTWQKTPIPTISYQAKALTFKTAASEINTGEVSLNATLHEEDKKWHGEWHIKDITSKGGAIPLPVMEGKGTFVARADHISLLGGVKSADNSYMANFSMEYAFNAPEKSLFILADASMPWNSGTLSVQEVKIPLSGQHATKVNLKVQHASIDALLQMLTGKRASATGVVSGMVPVTIGVDGNITFHEGSLKAEQPGIIIMAPDAIPGDNEQITVMREVLKNLHYANLSIAVKSGKGNKMSVLLLLEGNNPDVYEGRPVKLNVHLTGDMLSLMQQSLMPFMNPQQLLK
jgi:hypothetical protein